MCDAKKTTDPQVGPAVADKAATGDGLFIVIRDVSTADLHIKGAFTTAAEAAELQAEFEAAGKVAGIAFIGSEPTGRVSREVAEVPVSAPTVDVLVLK